LPVSSLGTWRHLATRFFSVVFSPGLNPTEAEQVRGWLSNDESEVFFAQPEFDQRHGLEAARHVAQLEPQRTDLIRAALLHDIGKRHAGLGPMGRTIVSVYIKLGGRPKGKWHSYLDHGQGAATELEALGAEPIVVEFAREHHGSRPELIAEEDWAVLQAADQV